MSLNPNHKMAASLAAATVLVALAVAVSFWAFAQLEETAAARRHTAIELNRADDLLSALKDAETGQRGYLLTGDEAFLQPYLAVRDSLTGQLEELRQISRISAARERLNALVPLVSAKLAELAQVIELYRNQDPTTARTFVGSGYGKHLMDSIRAEVGSFIEVEERVQTQHDAEFRASMGRLFAIIIVFSLFGLLSALAFAYFIHRESQHRLKNLALLQAQHLLELREETNQQLQQANITLQISEEKLAVTLHSIGDAVIATDAEARVTFLNPLAERLTGWTQAQAANRPIDEIFRIINQETRQPVTIPVKATLAHGTNQDLANHTVLIARDGSECAIADSCAPIRGRDAQVLGAVLVFRDVTKEYATERSLRDSAEKLRLFADNVPAMTVSWDENLRCRFANKAFAEFYGVTVADSIGRHIVEILGVEAYGEIEGHYARVLQGHAVGYHRVRKLRNREPRDIEVKLLPQLGEQRKVLGVFAVTTDITEHKLTEERIQRVAHHDSLTGLPNRLLFNDRLRQAMSRAKRDSRQFALLYLDLDKFKQVNDTLGHAAGDELLTSVAARIRQQVRESDTVARVGGDEFTVILPDLVRREEAEAVATKIIAALAAPFRLGNPKQGANIGTSVGIAIYPADGRDADTLVKAADAAMYSAKQTGSSFRVYAA